MKGDRHMNKLNDILCALKEYINNNWISDYCENGNNNVADYDIGITKAADYTRRDARNLEELMGELGESFHEMLFRKIRESGLPDADIYKKANIDRKLFSKIRSNPAYHPRKRTVLALAVALRLSIDETIELLTKAEYALSPGSKGDLIVKYFIERNIYDIDVINFALHEFEQSILGG